MEVQDSENYKAHDDFQPKNRSCLKCGHMQTCTIFRTISKYLQAEFPEANKTTKPPFKAEQVANLCAYYMPLVRTEDVLDQP